MSEPSFDLDAKEIRRLAECITDVRQAALDSDVEDPETSLVWLRGYVLGRTALLAREIKESRQEARA